MSSQFMGLEVGKRGLVANQNALNTVSHNLSNASNKNYSRQEVQFQTLSPLYAPSLNRAQGPGQMGQGMSISDVSRVRDQFVDTRIRDEKANVSFYKTKHLFLQQMEQVFAGSNQSGIKDKFDDFLKSWSAVALNPGDPAPRSALVRSSQSMISVVKDHYKELENIKNHVNDVVQDKVKEVNSLADSIKNLNVEITKIRALKDNPNDLLDKRDALIEKLSEIVNVKVAQKDPDEVFVYIGSQALVQGVKANHLEALGDGSKEGMVDVHFKGSERTLKLPKGELASLIDVRDNHLPDALQKLNNFAINLAQTVNSVHRQGFGLTRNTHIDFFKIKTITNDAKGNYDANFDGQNDSTRLFAITGKEKLKLNGKINENGVLSLGKDENDKNVLVSYKNTDTVRDVIDKINSSSAQVTAHLDQQGHLVLKALYSNDKNKSFSLNHLEDSSVFLTSFSGVLQQSGNAGAFDMNQANSANKLATNNYQVGFSQDAANNLQLSNAILNNPSNIAVRSGKDTTGDGVSDQPNGIGDGSNAFRIISSLSATTEKNPLDPNVKLDSNAVMLDKGSKSFRPFLDTMVASLGEDAKSSKISLDQEQAVKTGLENLRQSISGVNVDEELVQLIKYQHGYQGAAQIITTMNSMLDTLMTLGR